MPTKSNPFNTPEFLNQYWQQSPLLIRSALSTPDIISADELAGLSMEPEVESRIIKTDSNQENWKIQHGPFSETTFSDLGPENWTLLVQAVDHWVPEVRALLKEFTFLPQWRIDDIMISFATKGGGVGPHYDQYDVFLIQLEGTREWKIGQLCDENTELAEQMPVKVLTTFDEQDRWVMQPGDVLYLPPAVAHWGTSLDDSITISVGFRAPAESEIVSDFGHYLAAESSDFLRYSDAEIENRSNNSGEITETDIARLKTILKKYIDHDEHLGKWFGQYMTEPKYDDIGVETGDFSFNEFLAYWQDHPLSRNPASRLAYLNNNLFVDGQCINTSLDKTALQSICELENLTFTDSALFQSSPFQHVIWTLLNAGAVFFED